MSPTKRKVRAVRSYEQSAAVIVRMSPEQREQLANLAAAHAMSVNQFVLRMINLAKFRGEQA